MSEDEETRVYTIEDYGSYGYDLQDATRPYPAEYSTAHTSPAAAETDPTRPYERSIDETLPLSPEVKPAAEASAEDATRVMDAKEQNQQSAQSEAWHAPVGHAVPSLAELGQIAKIPASEPTFAPAQSYASASAPAFASTGSALVPAAPTTFTHLYPVQTVVPALMQDSIVMVPGCAAPLMTAHVKEQSQRARNFGLIAMICCFLTYIFFPSSTGLTSIFWLTSLVTSICAIVMGNSDRRKGAKSSAGTILGWTSLCISLVPLALVILFFILLIIFGIAAGITH
ncbi:MAG: hypothetical protein Q4P78_01040 [Rothia sp. (in: high G+C Gram-positive bacteria)]|uniref:hypothetical protein n=1 Tax=Rothia sp. (in: high G+C Gram-positive bacteria) TaxID=1885016 RepID=UPI0026DF3ED3|nr:hypothetical protein [Rothia sp. (in: high G+C Gram-positive bacteria)]MDO5749773.1 hypothetical protein [Rothia sp. (in: high G+C Gram-positive bacteria)]